MAENGPPAPMLPLAVAAAMTGRPAEALRSMARRGKIQSAKGNDGRMLVEVPTWLTAGQPVTTGQDQPLTAEPSRDLAGRIAELELTLAELQAELAETRTALAVAQADRDAARAIATAEAEAVKRMAEAEITAARRIAEAEIAAAKAEAQAKDLLIAELRRPWWRKLLGP
jgi:hypothetical protein